MKKWTLTPFPRHFHEVCRSSGDKMVASNTVSMALRPEIRLMNGTLRPQDYATVKEWMALNAELLVAYWEGRISTKEFVLQLKGIGSTGNEYPASS